jgi:hypothetical protein
MNFLQRLFGRAAGLGASGGAYTEPQSGLVFPMELGGLRRLAAGRPYAEGDRAGESIPYGSDDVQATIYVTSVGETKFPDGGDSEFIASELESALEAVREMERLGRYQSVKFLTAAPEKLGNNPGNLLWARGAFFAMTEGRLMISFTYITALHSRVIKLRMSGSDPDNKTLVEFPQALGELISGQQ